MNKFNITQNEPWLAPLAGYSDLPFRLLCRKFGAGPTCTEMVSVKGLGYNNKGTTRLLQTCPEDEPVVVQIFGSEESFFKPVMEFLLEQGFRNFDLNSGCSVKKVLKSGSGCALMEDPAKLASLTSIMVETAAQCPDATNVGVKFRLGFPSGEDNYLEVGKRLQDVGATWVTLHPRYGKQLFGGTADWSKLAMLKQHLDIPVIGSGDLYTAEDGHRCIEETGIDAVMFARGALYDPAIFDKFRQIRSGETPSPVDGEHLAKVILEHIRLTRQYQGDTRSFRKIRSIIPRYAKGLHGIRTLRNKVTQCTTWEELLREAESVAQMELPEINTNTDFDMVDEMSC